MIHLKPIGNRRMIFPQEVHQSTKLRQAFWEAVGSPKMRAKEALWPTSKQKNVHTQRAIARWIKARSTAATTVTMPGARWSFHAIVGIRSVQSKPQRRERNCS